MTTPKPEIVQFGPSARNPNEPGAYGWGFEVNGLRFVMYLPKECDHPMIKEMETIQRTRHKHFNEDDRDDRRFKTSRRTFKRNNQNKQTITRNNEHGPAHVHVINMENGRESKLELIEPAAGGNHFARFLDQNGNGKTPLTPEEIDNAINILNDRVAEFIECWRTGYMNSLTHSNLSGQVTRMSELFPDAMRIIYKKKKNQRVKFEEKFIEFEDDQGKKCVFPFDDYVAALKDKHSPRR